MLWGKCVVDFLRNLTFLFSLSVTSREFPVTSSFCLWIWEASTVHSFFSYSLSYYLQLSLLHLGMPGIRCRRGSMNPSDHGRVFEEDWQPVNQKKKRILKYNVW